MPKLNELFGEDSFDSPMHNPWEILIGSSREHHCLSNGLQHAWSHLQNSFQEVATNEQKRDDTLLLNQELKNAGFSKNGQLYQSVTKALTKELEKARADDLGVRLTGQLERERGL